MAEGIIKDVGNIYTSVFDQKPVLRREIAFFVREFEEKRRDREVDHLFKTLERVSELREAEIPKASSLADIHLPKLTAELQVAESIATKLIEKEDTTKAAIAAKLLKKKGEREAEWDEFVHHMTTKCIRIDSKIIKEEEEVKVLYKKADAKFENPQSES